MSVFSRLCCRVAAVSLGLSYALLLHISPSRSTFQSARSRGSCYGIRFVICAGQGSSIALQ